MAVAVTDFFPDQDWQAGQVLHASGDRYSLLGVLRRVARNSGYLIAAEVVGKGGLALSNILFARLLAAQGYGALALAQTWVLYAALVVDLGTGMYGQREAARARGPEQLARLADEVFTLRCLLGVVVLAGFIGLSWRTLSQLESRLIYAAAALYLAGFAASLDWLFRGRERFGAVFIANVVSSAVVLGMLLGGLPAAHRVPTAALIWSSTTLVPSALYLLRVRSLLPRFVRFHFLAREWLAHLRESVFFSFSGALMQSYQYLPLLLLAWLMSEQEVGLFAAPYRLVINLGSLGFLLPMAFYPVCARLFAEDQKVFHQSRRVLLLSMITFGLPIAVMGTLIGPELMAAIFGPAYKSSGGVFQVIVWMVPLFYVRYVYGTTLLATGFQRLHLWASAAGLTSTLLLGIVLGRHFGVNGICAALLAGESAIVLVLASISRKMHGAIGFPEAGRLLRLLLLNLLLGLGGSVLLARSGWLIFTIAALVAYPAGLLLARVVNIRALRSLTSPDAIIPIHDAPGLS